MQASTASSRADTLPVVQDAQLAAGPDPARGVTIPLPGAVSQAQAEPRSRSKRQRVLPARLAESAEPQLRPPAKKRSKASTPGAEAAHTVAEAFTAAQHVQAPSPVQRAQQAEGALLPKEHKRLTDDAQASCLFHQDCQPAACAWCHLAV